MPRINLIRHYQTSFLLSIRNLFQLIIIFSVYVMKID
jgi:hypothetical protein